MSENFIPTADPFDLATLDEETELLALASALRLADGFRLLFARCNLPSQRTRLMTKLEAQFPPGAIVEVRLTEPVPHLLDVLRERLDAPKPRAVFVSGLEHSLPVAAEAENTSFVANLNSSHNSFAVAFSCPLVLWLPEYALNAIVRGAPDFFSICSGTYFFAATQKETVALFQASNLGEPWQLASLSHQEKLERCETIESLLQDYQALPPKHRDYPAEAQLLERLGHLHILSGQWAKAEQEFRQILPFIRGFGDRQGEAATVENLGVIYQHQGRWSEAEQAYQQSLEISRELGDSLDEGLVLGNIALVKNAEGHLEEAISHGRSAIKVLMGTEDKVLLTQIQNLVEDWERLKPDAPQSVVACAEA